MFIVFCDMEVSGVVGIFGILVVNGEVNLYLVNYYGVFFLLVIFRKWIWFCLFSRRNLIFFEVKVKVVFFYFFYTGYY